MICKFRLIITLILLVAACGPCVTHSAARSGKAVVARDTVTAAKAFLRIPETDLDLLILPVRQDMVDYMEADSIRKTRNIYNGLSWIEKMTPGYMKVHLTDVSTLQIKILPLGKNPDGLVMTVYTVSDGEAGADSALKFYDPVTMTELPLGKFFPTPDPKVFFNIPKDAPLSRKDIERMVPFHTIDFTVNPVTGALEGRMTSADHLSTEDAELIDPYRIERLEWFWTGKHYKLLKDPDQKK